METDDFDNVETYFSYECEDSNGWLVTHFNGGDGYYVTKESYDKLLQAYKELKHRMGV